MQKDQRQEGMVSKDTTKSQSTSQPETGSSTTGGGKKTHGTDLEETTR